MSYGLGPQCPLCKATTEIVGGFNATDCIKCPSCGYFDHWQDEEGMHFVPHDNHSTDLSTLSLSVIQDELTRRGYVALPLNKLTDRQIETLAKHWREQAKATFAHADALEKHHSSIAF